MASWPRPNPAPNSTAVGSSSSRTWLGWLPGLFQVLLMTMMISALKPIATIMNASRDQSVDRTERIFVHSALSSPKVMTRSIRRRGPGRARPGRTQRCPRSSP